jgi:3-phenylpropionate/trans-cinnamate dioxygenase ferredoxin component
MRSQPTHRSEPHVLQWVKACAVDDVDEEDVIAFVHNGKQYAVYRSPENQFFVTDGLCTHEKVSLADGLVMGHIIECPKHNGRFDYRSGEGKGAPICEKLATYPTRVEDGAVFTELA